MLEYTVSHAQQFREQDISYYNIVAYLNIVLIRVNKLRRSHELWMGIKNINNHFPSKFHEHESCLEDTTCLLNRPKIQPATCTLTRHYYIGWKSY